MPPASRPSTRCPSARDRSTASSAHAQPPRTPTHDPRPQRHRDEYRGERQTGRDDGRKRQRPRPAPAGRGRAVPAQRAGDRVWRRRSARSAPTRPSRRARRQQQRRLARARHTRHHRVQPSAAEQPHQQRLPQRAAAQPAHVEGVLAHRAAGRARDAAPPRRGAAPGCRTSPATAAPTAPPMRQHHDHGDHARRSRRRRNAARRRGPTRASRESCSAAPAPA